MVFTGIKVSIVLPVVRILNGKSFGSTVRPSCLVIKFGFMYIFHVIHITSKNRRGMFFKNDKLLHKIHFSLPVPREAKQYKQKHGSEWSPTPVHCFF